MMKRSDVEGLVLLAILFMAYIVIAWLVLVVLHGD